MTLIFWEILNIHRNVKKVKNFNHLFWKDDEEAFAGEAAKAGFETEEDVQDYMREIRKEIRGY